MWRLGVGVGEPLCRLSGSGRVGLDERTSRVVLDPPTSPHKKLVRTCKKEGVITWKFLNVGNLVFTY